MQGSDGSFYGTTYDGGANGYGTVFRINAGGSLTTLWAFTNGVDGANSYATLVQGTDGNFYGTTSGSGSGPGANGTVFRITLGGNLTNLWAFTGCSDGANPGPGSCRAAMVISTARPTDRVRDPARTVPCFRSVRMAA